MTTWVADTGPLPECAVAQDCVASRGTATLDACESWRCTASGACEVDLGVSDELIVTTTRSWRHDNQNARSSRPSFCCYAWPEASAARRMRNVRR